MKKYGITSKPKTSFFYKQYHYEHLIDAVNYAKSDTKSKMECYETDTLRTKSEK
jgi:hypothetical protein